LHAGCAEKPVTGSTQKLCARPGFETEPTDIETVKAFKACSEGLDDPSCPEAVIKFLSETGCGNTCFDALFGPRAAACQAVADGQQALCLATPILVPCPEYPEEAVSDTPLPAGAESSAPSSSNISPPASASDPPSGQNTVGPGSAGAGSNALDGMPGGSPGSVKAEGGTNAPDAGCSALASLFKPAIAVLVAALLTLR
jgi:hypothetical protein